MTESEESCSSSNFDSKNSNYSKQAKEDTDDEFEEFDINKFVQKQIDLAVREASNICAENERRSSTETVLPLRSFTNWCRTKCRRFNLKKMITFSSLLWSLANLALLFLRTSQIVREPPPAVPFFRPLNGTVQDFFDGDGFIPELLMAKSEFVIVMLYAPWDYRCKHFRRSFVDVANAFSNIDSVKFVAANCHYYRGQCRRMYKIHAFPVVFALSPYPNGHPILYNQILSVDKLLSWVLHLLNPLQRLHSLDELQSAVLSSNFLVVGHFSLENGVSLLRSYHVFLNTAYKLADFRASVAFAVVLNRSLALGQLGFDSDNQINLYSFYEDNPPMGRIASIDIEPSSAKSQELANWVKEQTNAKAGKVVHQLELEDLETAGKSDALFRRLNSSSATLVLFSNSLGFPSLCQSQVALRNFAKLFHHCPPHSKVPTESGHANFPQLTLSRHWLIGAGCRINKSLGFLALDNRFGRHFMHKWGILPTDDDQFDAVAIVAREDERIFVMENARNVTFLKLANFVDGFYNKTLKWKPKNEQIFEPIGEEEGAEHFFRPSILERINRQMFLDRILNTNRSFDAVIFFSGGAAHGPSQSVLHFFHQTQHFFGGFEELIRFIVSFFLFFFPYSLGGAVDFSLFSIDSSQNSFDWHFNFHHLPAVAFFPSKSKESFVFHAEFAFSVPNLLGFVFPRCQPKLRWLLALSLCRGQCLERNLRRVQRMVAKARDDVRILRGMIRKMRFKKDIDDGLRHSAVSVRHFQMLLKKRQLQKATLFRLYELIEELKQKQWDDEDNARDRERMATTALLANWLLTTDDRIATDLP